MSTHLFQIGDIVRINEPTLKQWTEIRTRGFHPVEISPYIGCLAVVVETWNSGEAVSDACVLRTCDEDYVFDPCGPFDGADIPTIGGHLTLVQASPLRTMRVRKDAPDGLSGCPLPMAYTGLGFGIASHLSLVRESKLRTYVMTEASQLPMVNRPLPLAGTRITHRIKLPDSSIIEESAVVSKIYQRVYDFMVVIHNPREDDKHLVVSPSELRPPFSTF